MVHHLVLFKLRPEVDKATVDSILLNARISLLRIKEVLAVRCGKRINPNNPWDFFLIVDLYSMDKLPIYAEDAFHIKFVEEFIKPNIMERLAMDYESDPLKNVKYS